MTDTSGLSSRARTLAWSLNVLRIDVSAIETIADDLRAWMTLYFDDYGYAPNFREVKDYVRASPILAPAWPYLSSKSQGQMTEMIHAFTIVVDECLGLLFGGKVPLAAGK
jgi:hypothetical protein